MLHFKASNSIDKVMGEPVFQQAIELKDEGLAFIPNSTLSGATGTKAMCSF